jgi:DNA-binding HxlR family transcriptional regulator
MARARTGPLERRGQGTARETDSTPSPGQFSVPVDGYLGLLLNETRRALLEALVADGPMPRRQLKERIAYISPSTFERALGRLVLAGLVCGGPLAGDKRQRLCQLTPAAIELLQIAREVIAVEAWAPAALRGEHAPALMLVLADECARMIPRELLDAPLPYTELCSRLPELSDSTFAEHLSLLVQCGLLRVRSGSRPEEHIYELTELAPALARAAALAARLRLRMTPNDAPWLTGDLPSFLKLLELAPALRAPRDARGAVLLHVIHRDGDRGWPDVEVALEHGRIAQRRPGTGQPRASARALPVAWFDAILDENLAAIEIEGDVPLAHTLLAAITQVINACPRA